MAEAQKGRQMRFTEDELALIKDTFKGNDRLLKLLRKVFLPEYDPEAPIGQALDLWLATPVDQLSDEQAIALIRSRNATIGHVEFQIHQLQILSEMETLTPEQIAEKAKANSSQ